MKSISSTTHPLIKHFVKLQQKRSYRYEQQRVIIEGKKMVSEICSKKPALNLFVLEGMSVDSTLSDNIYEVPGFILEKIATTKTPEGIIAEVKMPPSSSLKTLKILALDGINDPGNLGTLLRSALAFGWDGVLLLENCADPYNPKALRAAKGATFRLSLEKGTWDTVTKSGYQILAADLGGVSIEDISSKEKQLLVLGSEASGFSQPLPESATKIHIPMSSSMESLNVAVAGSILMHALRGNR